MKTDIVIPCYNCASTLQRAVESCLKQPELNRLWLIDDASTDETWPLIQTLRQNHSERISSCRLPENGGVARARNWGALQSNADIVAFLDADDAYQENALSAAVMSFAKFDYLGLIRLRLIPIGLPERYANHPNLAKVWQILNMTGGGNTIFRRNFLLACGGFPQDELFRHFGGEDGALGIATVNSSVVGTLFDDKEPGVLHYCRKGMHAERLLDAHLFHTHHPDITSDRITQAEHITETINARLASLKKILNVAQCGTMPIQVERE